MCYSPPFHLYDSRYVFHWKTPRVLHPRDRFTATYGHCQQNSNLFFALGFYFQGFFASVIQSGLVSGVIFQKVSLYLSAEPCRAGADLIKSDSLTAEP